MKIAILTRLDYKSPRILAESLKHQLEQVGVFVEIFDDINLLNRLVAYKNSKLSFHFWLKERVANYIKDNSVLKKLKQFDAIVISECSPNGFWKRLYNVERFKQIVQKPLLFYEVYFLGNAPSQIKRLKNSEDALIERYDFHLSVSAITEIKTSPSDQWYPIGIFSKSWNLAPFLKKEIVAIIDFVHPGNEFYRDIQIRCLKKAGIKYISLEKPYAINEIRKIYHQGAIYFMQSYEAFGVPVLECLCCGNQIFTHDSGWPMAWRLDGNPSMQGEVVLPDCFTIYGDEAHLMYELNKFKNNYDPVETPKKVFQTFLNHYADYYYGNEKELKRVLNNIKSKSINVSAKV